MRKLSAKWVPKCLNADQKRQRCQSFRETFEIFFVVIQIISCRARLVTVGEAWLYHYDPETKQQSVEWRHSGSPRHKHSEYKNPLEKFSPQFFGIKTASSALIIFQRAKLSTRSITYFCWCNWNGILKEKRRGRVTKVSCSCTTMPRLTGHLQPRRKWPTWVSNTLITHPILRIWPYRTTTCSLDWKNNWKVVTFRSTPKSLLPRGPGWTDIFLIFFLSGFQKWEQEAKKYIELRGEYVE